jgi:hypothetical protein
MGGGGKGGSSTQTVSIPPEVIARYNAVNARAEEVAKTPFQQYSTDPNAFVAPLNATQQAGVAGANQYANYAQPYFDVASQYTQQGAAAANPTALNQAAINQYMSPYLNNVVGATMANLRQQQQQEQSQLAGAIGAKGGWGGDRAGITAANLARQQELASGQTLSNLLNQGYGQALQTAQQQQGLGLAAQQANLARLSQAGQSMGALGTAAQGAGLAGAQAQLAAGQVGQQTEQAGKSALYNQFLQQQGYPFQVTQFLANIAEGTGALSGSTTSTVQASDRRLKHDIKHIGYTNDGEPLYSFKYNGDDKIHFGPMAQNVEKKHPENVGLAGGYKTVDYEAVADRAAEHSDKQHAYRGGLIHSEGGAVLPMHAREGFAGGGLGLVNPGVAAGFDPDFINEMLKNRENSYAQLYGQPGGPRGAQGLPGGTGVVPKPMAVSKPITPASPPPRQPNTFKEAMQTGKDVATLYGAGKELKKDYTEWQAKREAAAAAEKAAAEKSGDTAQKSAEVVPETPTKDVAEVTGKAFDDDYGATQLANAADWSNLFSARGGRIGKTRGGGFTVPGYGSEDPSNIMNDVVNDTESDAKEAEGSFNAMKPKGGGLGGGGGDNTFSTALSVAGLAMKAIPFLLSTGGVAGRKGYALPGAVRDERSLDLAPSEYRDTTDEGLGRIQLASREPDAGGVLPPQDENFDRSVKRTLQFEGKLNPRDTNGTPSLYGINQAAHPDVDFKSLTPEKATQIYRRDYWDSIGAGKMDPNLAHVAFDTAVIAGPGKARQLLKESGGDPAKLLDLREQFQNSLIERNPEKFGKYQAAWNNRVNALRQDIGVEPSKIQVAAYRSPDEERRTPPRDIPNMQNRGDEVALSRQTRTEPETETRRDQPVTTENKLQAGKLAGVALPGTAGTGRGAVDEYSAPFLNIANKLAPDLPGFLKTENFWIPALATLASGLSSRAPTKIQGIGEALSGGIGAYTGMKEQQARLAESAARTEKTYADVVKDNVFEIGGRGWFRYQKPDGGWDLMPIIDYFKMSPEQRKNIRFDPRVETAMPDILRDFNERYAPGAKTQTQEPAKAPAGVQTRPSEIQGTPSTTQQPAARRDTTITAGAIVPSPEALKEVQQTHEAIVQGGSQRSSQEPDYYTPQKEIADVSLNVRPILTSLTSGLSSLPMDQSIMRSGRAQEVLQPIAQYMNSLAGVAGLPELVNPADLANADSIAKAVRQFQQAATTESGQKAYAAFRDLAETLPTTLNSPRAQAQLLSSIYLQNQINIDKQEYFDSIRKQADKFDPTTALKTGRSANAAFNKEFNAEFYLNEKKNLEKMFGTTIQGMKDPKSGRDMTVMQVLTTDPGRLTREDKADIVKQFGGDPRILRYFGVSM